MTWMHWVLLGCLVVLALAVAFEPGSKKSVRLVTFSTLVGLMLLLIMGQPK